LPVTIPDTPAGAGPDADAAPQRRSIRSFVARAGRMTVAQERAWRDLWPRYGLEGTDETLDLDAVFGRTAARTLEIGFGNGESLVALAQAHPDEDFLGIEVHRPGVGHLMLRAEALELGNIRVVCRDAVETLSRQLPDASLAAVLLYFPDPWPKKRHHKRRIVQPAFVAQVARKLEPGGRFRLATDWQHYAEQMLEVVGNSALLENEFDGGYAPRPDSRPLTRFETRGQRLGHEVWDLCFRKP
jgi:tRNA (guanine-N7-)-methyltransferase